MNGDGKIFARLAIKCNLHIAIYNAKVRAMNTHFTTAEAILAVPLDEPERLFAYDRSTLKREWHRLAALWHPDRNRLEPRAQEVLQHINVLYETARQKIASGHWKAMAYWRWRKTQTDRNRPCPISACAGSNWVNAMSARHS
jgi:hypothetical protein